MERILFEIASAALVFVAGKRYGARVESGAVTAALDVFTKGKALLVSESGKALAAAKAEEARIAALIAKYL